MLEWSDDLATGIQKVDEQHKEIIKKVNELYYHGSNGLEQEVILEMIRFLEKYIVTHFREEEEYQEKCKYPNISEHKRYHRELEKEVLELKQRAETEGATATLITKANRILGSWLVEHIRREDKDFATYYRQHM